MLKKLLSKSALSVLFIMLAISLATTLSGQKKASRSASTFDGSKNAFFVELLGNGLLFSANYDVRVANKFGIRAGIGYFGSTDGEGGILTVPAMGNFLLGSNGRYFEIGAGLTYVKITGTEDIFDVDKSSSVFGTLSFMYRRQPVDGGFMWKIGLTPFLAEGVFIPYWGGVGIGYCW
jgi:hypothetical protein